jgi:hypothetical protein
VCVKRYYHILHKQILRNRRQKVERKWHAKFQVDLPPKRLELVKLAWRVLDKENKGEIDYETVKVGY